MHLGKIIKFNMILAILVCMAFVVNLGSTFASAQYTFKAQSINIKQNEGQQNEVVQNNVYTDYGYAQGSQGKYIYSPGIYNNQLSINYGFREDYDLIIRFSATYENSNHSATDCSLNFANRDNWLVDMGSVNGLRVDDGGQTVVDTTQTYYNLTSSSNTITGVMYYMGKISGSGTMPIISGVNFYTSPNNSFNYIGDTLTITLTPEYVKSDDYDNDHTFNVSKNGFTPNATIFNNWISYMKGTANKAENAQYMIYNAYVYDTKNDNDKSNDRDMSLKYPVDESLIDTSTGLVKPNAVSPMYVNTAYRYNLAGGTRNYEALTAGNRYYGGLGVYVIPNPQATNKIVTVSITVGYVWQKDGQIDGFVPSGAVSLKTSSDITTITNNGTNYHYYKYQITSPTYINVLDYIMLTAENYDTIVKRGYSLILNNINVSLETDSNLVTDVEKEAYTISNSTNTSPLLARATNITSGSKSYETDISITNNTNSAIKVTSFKIRGYLWYGAYTTTSEDDGNGETDVVEHFVEMPLGGEDKSKCYLRPTYLKDQDANGYGQELSEDDIWKYDTNLWSVSYSNLDNVYTFRYNAGVAYISSGYTMTLIKGVTIPKTTICQNETTANDFWCSIEVVNVEVSDGDVEYGSLTSTNGIETIVEGYYSEINSSNPGKIYIRNNTNQVITKLDLSNLFIYSLNAGNILPRDRVYERLGSDQYTIYNCLTKSNSSTASAISIKPNETVLAYEITPNTSAVIFNYEITADLESAEYTSAVKLTYNAEINKGEVVNTDSKFYEFRLVSSSKLNLSDTDFIEKQVETMFYYYYIGIICPNQCITIFDGDFASNVIIEEIEHDDSWDSDHYVANNYNDWGLEEGDEWLEAMKTPFKEPTPEERQNAIKVEIKTN